MILRIINRGTIKRVWYKVRTLAFHVNEDEFDSHYPIQYGYVWCGASAYCQDESIEKTENTLVKIVEIDTSDGFTRFVDQSGEYWHFVTPYDFIKDEPIFTI